MAPFVLKFKGNKSFSPFSNLTDGDALTRTWKVCTKVAAHLEQGQRLENLSWRLWHLHNLMVDSDADNNAKSRREFKRLSRHTGERLDRDKNRDISDLQAPKFTAERLRQRAEEKERCRLASEKTARAMRGRGIRGMQYTFALKPAAATSTTTTVIKSKNNTPTPGLRPRRATDATKFDAPDTPHSGRPRSATTTATAAVASDIDIPPHDPNDADVDTEHDEDLDMEAPTLGLITAPGTNDSTPAQGLVSEADMLNLMEDGEASLLRFETLFGGFGPNHLLVNPHAPSFTQPALSYGEAAGSVTDSGDVSVGRPTFELQLDELLSDDAKNKSDQAHSDGASKPRMSRSNTNSSGYNTMGVMGVKPDADSVPLTQAYAHTSGFDSSASTNGPTTPTTMNATSFNWGGEGSPPLMPAQSAPTSPAFALRPVKYGQQSQDSQFAEAAATFSAGSYDFAPNLSGGVPPLSLPVSSYTTSPTTTSPTHNSASMNSRRNSNTGGHSRAHSTGNLTNTGGTYKHPATININTSNAGNSKTSTPTSSPTSRTHSTPSGSTNANGAPSATPPPTRGRSGSNALPLHGNTAPGGVKSECANCGANSTPLWRRGLNDELNCNACGLYCKLHKRPRPKTLRNSGGEGGSRNPGWHAPRGGNADGDNMGEPVSCYNCHTTATPLWRKDEEGRTLCNACGLYLKLHGERRPSSMKSDVIRKRSRHDARRPGNGNGSSSATPSASPGASRRASPTATSPTVNQDPATFSPSATSEQHMPYYGSYDYSHSSSGMMGADEQMYPSYAPSPSLMFGSSVNFGGQVGYNTQPYFGPFLPNMMDTSGESPNETGPPMTGSPTHTNSNGGMGMSSHTSSGAGRPPAHKKRRMSTADTLASSTSGSERSDGTPSFLDDLANPNVPDPSRASPSATFIPNNYQYTSFSPSLTYPNLPGNDPSGNNLSYFHPPMVLPWLHNDVLTNVGAKPEPIDEPMNSGELSIN
ncbi:GATA type zinc finger [Rhizoctonia solani]|uniref:GATA type zinc finger n=1 Tax=Rhizoctonia solani TaxID=456999 RepID=A0A8H8T1C8_9AGAM|nr:GATA type zinc finger [Rhizoctonia solani]QRW26321.1 GATA type zinc finger [Rhizoctonia solani]